MGRQLLVVEQCHRWATLRQVQCRNLGPHIHARVPVRHLEQQQDVILAGEGLEVSLQQHLRGLALAPLEYGEKGVARGGPELPDARIEVIGIHAQGHHVDGSCDAAGAERLRVESARHPHLVHLVTQPDPFLGDAVHLKHRVADAVPSTVLGEEFTRGIHDLWQIQVLGPLTHRCDAGVVPLCVHPVRAVDVRQPHIDPQSVQLEEQLPRRDCIPGSRADLRMPEDAGFISALQFTLPSLTEDLLRSPKHLREIDTIDAGGDVLVVDQRHAASADGPEPGFCRPQAVVGVLKVGEKHLVQWPNSIQHHPLDIHARAHDALHVAIRVVLVDVLLQAADLLPPETPQRHIGAGVQEPAVGQDQPAAHDANVISGVGHALNLFQPTILGDHDVVIEEQNVVIRCSGADTDVVAAHKAQVLAVLDQPDPVQAAQIGQRAIGAAVIHHENLYAVAQRGVSAQRIQAGAGILQPVPRQHDDRDPSQHPHLPARPPALGAPGPETPGPRSALPNPLVRRW